MENRHTQQEHETTTITRTKKQKYVCNLDSTKNGEHGPGASVW